MDDAEATARYREPVRIAALGALVLMLAGCGSMTSPFTRSDVSPAKKTEPRALASCAQGALRRVESPRRALAAVVAVRATAYRAPGQDPIARFGRLNVNGVPTVLAVRAKRLDRRCAAQWYRVQLPMRPNGIVGWVRASEVELAAVTTRIVVDLSERRIGPPDRVVEVLAAPGQADPELADDDRQGARGTARA